MAAVVSAESLTNAESSALKQALADGGKIIMAGIDRTDPRPRRDVVMRLVRRGLLNVGASAQTGISIGINDYFTLTPKGEAVAKAISARECGGREGR